MKTEIRASEIMAMQEFVSSDITRGSIAGMNFTLSDTVAIRSTDGHVAGILITDNKCEGEGSFTVKFDKDQLKTIKGAKDNLIHLEVGDDGVRIVCNSMVFTAELFGDFANVDQIIPNDPNNRLHNITLNGDLLAKFTKCHKLLGSKRSVGLVFEFHADNLGPAIIKFPTVPGFTGVIMPMRA